MNYAQRQHGDKIVAEIDWCRMVLKAEIELVPKDQITSDEMTSFLTHIRWKMKETVRERIFELKGYLAQLAINGKVHPHFDHVAYEKELDKLFREERGGPKIKSSRDKMASKDLVAYQNHVDPLKSVSEVDIRATYEHGIPIKIRVSDDSVELLNPHLVGAQ